MSSEFCGGDCPRRALLDYWTQLDRGSTDVLFPPDGSQAEVPPRLFKSYRRLWLSYSGGCDLLNQLLKKGWEHTPRPWKRLLSLGFSELLWSPTETQYAIVSSWVEIAREQLGEKSVPVINGTLRNVARHLGTSIEISAYLPAGLIKAWTHQGWDPEMMTIQLDKPRPLFWHDADLESSPPIDDQLNALPTDSQLNDHHSFQLSFGHSPKEIESQRRGFFQNLSAAELCADIQLRWKGGHFLDLCAAPGGKTWQLHRLGIAPLYFHEHQKKRAQQMLSSRQASYFPKAQFLSQRDLEEQSFDAVLIDVPCSNSGVLSKCPEAIRHYWHPNSFFEGIQREVFLKALSLVHPQGQIFYATCSIDPQENESRVQQLSEAYGTEVITTKTWKPDEKGRHGAFLCELRPCE